VGVVAAVFVVYSPSLNGGFVWDDDAWTTNLDHLMADWRGLWRIWTDPTAMQQFYPLTGTSFWLDRQFWGLWTLPYHVENVLLHLLSCLLLWQLLRRLDVRGAGLAAAVFALHPVMVESVAWITERKNGLSLFFTLAALLAYGRFTGWWKSEALPRPLRRGAYTLAMGLTALALFSKITAFVLAPSMLLLAWWKHGSLKWRRDVAPTVPFFLLTFMIGGLVWWLEVHHVGAKGKQFSATPVERVITSGRAFWFYVGKLLWPVDLCFIYPDWRGNPWRPWHWAWPASVALPYAGAWWSRHKIGRGLLVALLFYLGALFPVIGVLDVYGGLFSPVWDHWVYVPALGILIPACAFLARLSDFVRPRWVPLGAAMLMLSALGVQAWRQSVQYADAETLWVETIERNPAAWMAHNNYGVLLVPEKRHEEAIECFRNALRHRENFADAWQNYGTLLGELGQLQEAVVCLRRARSIDPRMFGVHFNLGNCLAVMGKFDEAIASYQEEISKSDLIDAHDNLGGLLLQLGRTQDALPHLRRVVEARPDQSFAHTSLALALNLDGQIPEAVGHFEQALELEPANNRALTGYSWLLATHPDAAVRNGALAVELARRADESVTALRSLAAALAETGPFEEAVKYAEMARDRAEAASQTDLARALSLDTLHYRRRQPVRQH